VVSALLSFAVVAGLVTLVPGIDTALVLRATVTQGRRPAFATATGICCGVLVWGAAAAVGVSALLTASEAAYTALRLVGAAYMLWLGGRLLWGLRGATAPPPAAGGPPPEGLLRSWRRGFTSNVLNPKIGAFYVAVLPQFLPEGVPHLAMGLLLALVHNLEGMAWFSLLILGAHGLRSRLAGRRAQRVTEGVTGTALVGFGVELGLAR
jgi:threonine/homoserine/homoserine lactone efflux protein